MAVFPVVLDKEQIGFLHASVDDGSPYCIEWLTPPDDGGPSTGNTDDDGDGDGDGHGSEGRSRQRLRRRDRRVGVAVDAAAGEAGARTIDRSCRSARSIFDSLRASIPGHDRPGQRPTPDIKARAGCTSRVEVVAGA
jgi:hypothetical protein